MTLLKREKEGEAERQRRKEGKRKTKIQTLRAINWSTFLTCLDLELLLVLPFRLCRSIDDVLFQDLVEQQACREKGYFLAIMTRSKHFRSNHQWAMPEGKQFRKKEGFCLLFFLALLHALSNRSDYADWWSRLKCCWLIFTMYPQCARLANENFSIISSQTMPTGLLHRYNQIELFLVD